MLGFANKESLTHLLLNLQENIIFFKSKTSEETELMGSPLGENAVAPDTGRVDRCLLERLAMMRLYPSAVYELIMLNNTVSITSDPWFIDGFEMIV